MTSVRELTPASQTASDVALRWDTYSRQQTNAALNLLDTRLREARHLDRATYAAAAATALDHCAEALWSLGVA